MSTPAPVAIEASSRVCLSEVIRAEADLSKLIGKLKACETYENCTTVNETIRKTMNRLSENIEVLSGTAKEQKTRQQKDYIIELTENHRKQKQILQVNLRQVYVKVKANIDTKQARDRQELFKGTRGSTAPKPTSNSSKRAMVETSETTTEMMRDARASLAEQIQHSAATLDTILSSSNTASNVSREYETFSSVVTTSKQLVSKLLKKELTNNILFCLGLALFAFTCLYIIKKRMAYLSRWILNLFALLEYIITNLAPLLHPLFIIWEKAIEQLIGIEDVSNLTATATAVTTEELPSMNEEL